MDLYTRNILVGIFAVLVIGTVFAGEMITWAHCDLDTAKDRVQEIGLGVSTSGTLFLVFVYVKHTKKQRKKASKRPSFLSHEYHAPKVNAKR
jgi:hypothetical protein